MRLSPLSDALADVFPAGAGGDRVIGDSWYADALPGVTPISEVTVHWPAPVRRLLAVSLLRGIALYLLGRRGIIVTTYPGLATKVCTMLCALTGQRRVVILELIVQIPVDDHPSPLSLARRIVEVGRRFALQRGMLAAQVLSDSDAQIYAAELGIPVERFHLIRWPQRSEDTAIADLVEGRTVMASGRRNDWRTVIAAAEGTDWELVIVCAEDDAAEVSALCKKHQVPATVHVEISQTAHSELLAAVTVFVIAVPETGTSIGQIRVMNAIDVGAPLVVSDVVGLRGYVDEDTAVLVPPADPRRLRTAICDLLDDPARRDSLRRAAHNRASYTMADYLRDVDGLIAS